ncbi:MAG: DUF2784 domain-containing protein [Thermoanaerobaculia bacterium]
MSNRVFAELVLLAHFGFVLFAVFGGLLVLQSRRWAWIHVPAVIWASIVNLASWTCPLTPVEQAFRSAAGQAGYTGGFVEHYIGPLVYPGGMPRRLELVAAFSVVAWNVIVYATVLMRRRVKSEE